MTLTVRNLRITAAGREVVHGIDFNLAAGEALGLIGASGSGKSLTAKALLGLTGEVTVHADELQLNSLDLRRFRERDWQRLRGKRIGLVLQDALGSLDAARTIGAELTTAIRLHEPRLPPAKVRERAIALLERVGLPDPAQRLHQRTSQLSGGQRQRALIATAIAHRPQLLIADEPTTALDAAARRALLALLRELTDDGMATLFISHDLASVHTLCDRVAVIDAGRLVEVGSTTHILTTPNSPPARALVEAMPKPPDASRAAVPRNTGAVVLHGASLVRRYRRRNSGEFTALRVTELELRRGETLGVVGASGSGKSTLARQLLAVDAPGSARTRITLDGTPWVPARERDRRLRRAHIGVVAQDPLATFDPRRRADEILADALSGGGTFRVAAVRERATALLHEVGLTDAHLRSRPIHLSGGERQRLAIARALASEPHVLICDEAVSALDTTVRRQVLELLRRTQRERELACLFISHDLDVVGEIADRIAVLDAGEVVETGATTTLFRNPVHPATRALLGMPRQSGETA